jgi:addiction module HigA family antidote
MSRVDANSHPGAYIRQGVLPAGLSVTAAAKQLGIGRVALSNLLNGNASLSPDMAVRMEKSFGASSGDLLGRQAAYDQAKAREREPAIAVRAYAPGFLSIKAVQVQAWADRLEARAELPALLRKLVTSTSTCLSKVDFPAFENSQRPGWDGHVISTSATPWIPLGASGWEFGVNKEIAEKAEGDYRARTVEVVPEIRASTTFVFVTPRNWPGKTAWLAARRSAAEWKDVRAYDASDLEQWLEGSIPAQAWMGERLPLGASDIQSLDSHWKQWAAVTEPEMSKALFGPAAKAWGGKIANWLSQPAEQPFTVVADSEEEALAALVCAFESESCAEVHAGDRVVVVRSADALAKVTGATSDCIVVLASAEAERQSAGLHRAHHTVVVTRRNALEAPPDITVDLVDDTTFHDALQEMGFSHADVERLGRESGQSQTVLRRRLATMPAIKSPPWAAQQDIAGRLVPLVFIGAWDAASEADQSIVSDVAGVAYDAIERTMAELQGEEQCPVWSAGPYRGMVSKTDAFYAVQRLVTASDLRRFLEVARVVLSESDPALELPEEQRWASNLYGKSRKHSGALRQGLCETLVLLAVHGDNLFKRRLGFDVEGHVNGLVRGLLVPLDPTTWQSQRDDLPRYAEAAPGVFLDLLEQDLKSDEPKVHALMTPADSRPFSSPGRTGLLWALESLAWNPRWVFRVVRILAKLAEVKLNDNWVNKPEHSLAAIVRCWMPQTAAAIDQRLEAFDLVVRNSPEVGWRLCLDQFDPASTIGNHSARPRWRAAAAGAGEPVSYGEMHQMARRALDLAIGWQSHDDRTLGDLIDRLEGFLDDQDAVWAAIKAWAATNPPDAAKARLRERIRRRTLTLRGRRRGSTGTAPAQALKAYDVLTPADVVLRHLWLFEQHWVQESMAELADQAFNYEKREDRIQQLRTQALQEIWASVGLDGVVRLCEASEAPRVIGWCLASGVLNASEVETFVAATLQRGVGAALRRIDDCLAGLLAKIDAHLRKAVLASNVEGGLARGGQSATEVVRLLQCAPFGCETWDLVDRLPERPRKSYWKEVWPSRYLSGDASDANRAIDELLRADRPRAAFNMVGMAFAEITTERLARLLVEAATNASEPQGHHQLSPHAISDALKELTQRSEVQEEEVARLEFLYIDALAHTEHGIKNLERQLAQSPSLFMQAVAFAFKRDDDCEDPPELRAGNEQAATGLASAAYSLLSRARLLPGSDGKGSTDPRKLRDWLTQVRALTRQHAREGVGDSMIGQLLARSPAGADGIWPGEAVREALEDFGTERMASGMITGRFNARGAIYGADDGRQERDLAATYRESTARLAGRYPFTACVLDEMAAMYERDGDWHDTRSKARKRLRY